jgi:hypothetical protein
LKKVTASFYRTVIPLLILVNLILINRNYSLLKTWNSKDKVVNSNIIYNPDNNTKFGYSDAIDVISKYDDLKVVNITPNSDNNNFVIIDMMYKGKTDNLYNILQDIKSKENCYSIDSLKIVNDNTGVSTISVSAHFIVNK